jgi:putative membrane protein
MMMDGWSWWWMLPMVVGTIVVIAVIVGVLVALTRSGALSGRGTAEDILGERLARGEIDASEYAQRLDALNHRRFPTSR